MLTLNLAAFYIPALPPHRPAPIMQIRTPDGEWRDERHGGAAHPGPRGWDELLRKMGYTRITRHWIEIDDLGLGGGRAHMCKVVPAAHVGPNGHAVAHLTTGLLPTCTSYTLLSHEHAEQLGGLEFGFHSGDVIECEYAVGHRMPHTGLGQVDPFDDTAGGDDSKQRWWWLLWYADETLLSTARVCGTEGRAPGNGRPPDTCALPLGHETASPPHSWQLTALIPGRPASASIRAARGDTPPRWPGQH
ncbi:hypothetical protein E1262_27150 [Jiangella aurantiaca]|uniref:Uncharacterized protein n=1 Tax=Jiangella aurantiaca TaxID=2530373 RepID=A0A4R5A2J4_9ACTN|nr:hypothetical protein [Jiangella aurantiaca]TDD64769.1 hypothetical protein E1262_27150 [Jiangella aurantiaca]